MTGKLPFKQSLTLLDLNSTCIEEEISKGDFDFESKNWAELS